MLPFLLGDYVELLMYMLEWAYIHNVDLNPDTYDIVQAVLETSSEENWYYRDLCFLYNVAFISQIDRHNERLRKQKQANI